MIMFVVMMKTWCRVLLIAGLVLFGAIGVGGCTERDPDEQALRLVPVMRAQPALMRAIPYYTTVSGARAATWAIQALKADSLDVAPLQSYFKTVF